MTYFVMRYPSGEWVQRDDSTGPMSTGGYPFPTSDIQRATVWTDKIKALTYRGREEWTLHELEYQTKPAAITRAEVAEATQDKEYLEYLRLKKKFEEPA